MVIIICSILHTKQRGLCTYKNYYDLEQERERTWLSDTALAKYDGLVEPISILEACVWAVVQLRLLRDRHGQAGAPRDLS